jgi:hypothetical protein
VVPKSWDAKALASLEGPLPDKKFHRKRYQSTTTITRSVRPPAVKGHGFGLSLSSADRTALIAFLKTL